MKKILFTLLLVIFFIPSVNAESGNINGSSYTSNILKSPYARFYDNTNNNLTALSSPSVDDMYFKATATLVNSSHGAVLTLQTNEALKSGYVYALTVYIGSNGAKLGLPFAAARHITTDVSLGGAAANWNNSYYLATNYYMQDASSNINIKISETQEASASVMYYIFKVNHDGVVVAVPFTASVSGTYELYYYGYSLSSLGSASSLTTDEINTIVNNATSGLATSSEINTSTTNILSEIENTNIEIQNQIEESTNQLNDTITSTDTSESQTQANSFFEGFESDDYGLSDIITMPLDLIKGLTSNTCVALNLTLPFVNKSFDLPCMSSIYSQYFGNFFTLYQTITFGFVAYWVVVKIFALVKGFKDPDDDKVEVLDL